MLETLDKILARVVDQQKFAEAKNALLATVSGAGGMALIAALAAKESSAFSGHTGLILLSALSLVVAAVFSVLSFFPRLSNLNQVKRARPGGASNLTFFRDLARMREDDLLSRIAQALGKPVPSDSLLRDTANQIIVNSQIAVSKHFWFQVASIFLLFGLVLILGMLWGELMKPIHWKGLVS